MAAGDTHWPQVKALFEAALEHPQAAREAFVRASGADAAVQDEVLSLLAHERALSEATTDDFLAPTEPAAPPLLLSPGERLGAWEIVGPLGAGGMAEVMLARRADGAWDGEAAVKVLKRGMDSAAVLARFALEQRALARLNHPHIAHLLDAGRSASGLPYFVMELVRGRPIDQACEGLALEARLGLFLQLADAVAFAHRQLLVHRDLKPSNVLVTEDGQVKLLDFGIAKALDPAEGEHTGAGPRPYTPNYASPEQVRGEPVGTLTDIYSLGVLLYVMLTGLRPYGRNATTPQEAARSVLEEEPTRPSALSPGLVSDPQWMATRKRLKGDLDNILLKALDKAPAARYPSVDAFAADVRAHLAGLPVSARAPSAGYLLSRFVLRHRAASAAAALAVSSLMVGVGVATWQAHEADRQRARAEARFAQVRQLANQMVFKYHDQIAHLPGATAVRDALLQDAAGYLDALAHDVADDAGLARELAEAWFRLAVLQGESFSPGQERPDDALRSAEKALALLPLYLPQADVPALDKAVDLRLLHSDLLLRQGRLIPANEALAEASRLVERIVAQKPDDLQTLSRQATVLGRRAVLTGGSVAASNLGRTEEALQLWQQALAIFERMRAREPGEVEWVHQTAWAHHGLGSVGVLRGDNALALAHTAQAVALRDEAARRAPQSSHFRHQTAMARVVRGAALNQAGRNTEGRARLDEAEATMRALSAEDPGNEVLQRDRVLLGLLQGRLLIDAGQPAEARQRIDAAAEALSRRAQGGHDFYVQRWWADALLWSARLRLSQDPAEAAHRAAQVAAIMQGDDATSNAARGWQLAQALSTEGQALAALGRRDDARERGRQALRLWTALHPDGQIPGALQRWFREAQALSAAAP
ncbi:serine/threonine protein kinase [Ideonella sp. 4Y16]|uniref:serine/threonine-protein kinase n=1 Tax=Ideonella alba TaxID=2824118 RepID=UPI001B35B86F|nr:serine/threonine-protein kinase [Ideonella alba]MBQ0943238.1 serine/threonine protein kinase [Ideonella alba]